MLRNEVFKIGTVLVDSSTNLELFLPGFQSGETVNHLIEIDAFRQMTYNNIIDNIARWERPDCSIADRK